MKTMKTCGFDTYELSDNGVTIVSGESDSRTCKLEDTLNNIISKMEARTDTGEEFYDLLVQEPTSDEDELIKWQIIFKPVSQNIREFWHYLRETSITEVHTTIANEQKARYVKSFQTGISTWLLLFEKPTDEYLDYMARFGD